MKIEPTYPIISVIRPTMPCEENSVFWPNGFPDQDDSTKKHIVNYIDTDEQPFTIQYTDKQISDEAKKWGYFSPFIPLMVTTSINNKL